MVQNVKNRDFDLIRKKILSFLLLLPFICEPITMMMGDRSSLIIAVLHISFFVWSIWSICKTITPRNILLLFLFYLIIAINIIIFPFSAEYFFDKSALMTYLIYLPISVLCFSTIICWDDFFQVFKPYVILGTIIALFLILRVGAEAMGDDISYMQFSYFLLPIPMAAYSIYRLEKKWVYLLCFVLCCVVIFAYSARATIIFLTLYILVLELLLSFKSKKNRQGLLLIMICGLLIILFQDVIIAQLSHISFFESSRFLSKLSDEELLQSDGRDIIFALCMNRLDTVGFEYSGFFGDRPYLQGWGAYPHNFFIEIIMSMGWLVGSVVLLAFLIFLIVSYFKSSYKIVFFFLFFGLFARYIISGSYLIEGRFWIFIFCLVSMLNNKHTTIKRENICNNPSI